MFPPYSRFPSLVFLLGTGTQLAFAQTAQPNAADFYNLSLAELAQVEVSIATGNSTPLDRAPATASVVHAAEIVAMGARTLNDVLETVPGLHVSLSALSRLDSVYSIRGIHTGFNSQVLLLLNGIPVQYSTQAGRPTLFRLPVTSIDRVEVIRGPGSAIYGADAYSGVINVITKDAVSMGRPQIGGRSGSFGSRDLWLQAGTQWHGWGISFNMDYQESRGDESRRVKTDLQSALDTALGTAASLAPGPLTTRYQVLDSHLAIYNNNLKVNLWNWTSKNAGVGAGGAQALDPSGRDDSGLWLADMTYSFSEDSDTWDTSVRFAHLHYDQEAYFNLFPEGAVLPIGSDGNLNFASPAGLVEFPDGLIGNPGSIAKDDQLDFIAIYNGWESHRLRLATGTRRQQLSVRERKNFGPSVIDGSEPVVNGDLTDVSNTAFVFLPDSSRTIGYVSVQDEWQIRSDWQITAGLRYDDYSDFSSASNPRMAVVWSTNEKLTTKFLYGSAFRAPSFSEQHFQNNPVSLGNSDLRPERIDTLELSFNYRATDNLQSTFTLFNYQARAMIEFIPDPGATTSTAQNARNQDGRGLEWELNWQPMPGVRLNTNYSWQGAQDSVSEVPVPDAPGRQMMVNGYWEVSPQWFLHGQLNWVADRARSVGDPRPAIDDYSLVNFTLRRVNVFPNIDMALAIRNLTNEDAREPSSGVIVEDYPLESRSAWFEVRYQFQ